MPKKGRDDLANECDLGNIENKLERNKTKWDFCRFGNLEMRFGFLVLEKSLEMNQYIRMFKRRTTESSG